MSGRNTVKLGGTAEVFKAFVPRIRNKDPLDKSLFLYPLSKDRGADEKEYLRKAERSLIMAAEKIPYKIYLTEEEMPIFLDLLRNDHDGAGHAANGGIRLKHVHHVLQGVGFQ